MTNREFIDAVNADPAWATKVTEKTHILGVVNLASSPITHLSQLLEFHPGTGGLTGKPPSTLERVGKAADFSFSPLKNAAGIFHGFVNFEHTPISEIHPDFQVTRPNNRSWAADFLNCNRLKVAQGSYVGKVQFGESVEVIKNFRLIFTEGPTTWADFQRCVNLRQCPEEILTERNTTFNPKVKVRLLLELDARKTLKKPDLEL